MRNKVLLTWNIRSQNDREQHFQRLREFVNKLPTLGLELKDAWYTIYGKAPHILLGIVVRGKHEDQLESALASEEWQHMILELREYITTYRQRIVEDSDQFQF
ncbi:MAG: hypothetical protein ACYTAO_13710 [Planctomycetota bacterium]|jgi:hypothetical protein